MVSMIININVFAALKRCGSGWCIFAYTKVECEISYALISLHFYVRILCSINGLSP